MTWLWQENERFLKSYISILFKKYVFIWLHGVLVAGSSLCHMGSFAAVHELSHCDSSKFHLFPFLHSLYYIINTNLLIAQHNLIICCENQLITPCDCCMYTCLILSWKQGEWFSFHKAWSVCKSAASAVPGNMWELQNLKPHPRPTGQNLHFNKVPRWLMCTLTFEKCWLILLLCTWNPEQGCIHAVGVQHIIV